MVANNALRLPDFDNEHVEIVSFDFGTNGKRSWQYPNRAEFLTGQTGVAKTAVVYLHHPEDHNAFSKAGFDLKGFEGQHNPPITVLIQKDRIASVKGIGGQWIDVIHSREDAPLHVVTNALPAVERNPDNGEPQTPLAFVEPEAPAPVVRKSSDDGSAFTPNKARLYAKIAAVMGKVGLVGERGQSGQGYSYATDGDMFNAVRAEMAAANLAMLPPRLLRRYKDDTSSDYFIDILFTLADGDTGETDTTPWIAKLGNNTDKAIHAAMTMCVKYFLKYTFLIATEKDTDADADGSSSGRSEGNKPAARAGRKTPKEAVEDVQTGTAVINFIEVRVSDDKPDKPYIVGEGGYTTFTRKPFRDGSIPCEDWEKPGKYDLVAPVVITYKVKGTGPKEITGAAWKEDVES